MLRVSCGKDYRTHLTRRGFAAPTRAIVDGANPLAAVNGHAREARLSGFVARNAKHFARSEREARC
jgi:hypothetical protein